MKLKTKTIFALLLAAALVLQIFSSIPAIAAEEDTAYKSAYYRLIKQLHKGTDSEVYDRFKLIYVNDDSIPELLAVDTPSDQFDHNGTYQYQLYTYYDGKAVLLGDYASGVASAGGYRGNTTYLKKSGLILETYFSAGSGDGSEIIYKLQDGEMVKIAQGDFNIATETPKWNGKAVSPEKYDKKINKIFNTKKGISFENIKTISYSKMRKKLK